LVFDSKSPSVNFNQGDRVRIEAHFKDGGAIVRKIEKLDVELRTVNLYFYNPNIDKDANGNILFSRAGLVPVQRKIPKTMTPVQDTIRLLLKGELTAAEKTAGLSTEYPLPGFKLAGANLQNGRLVLSFEDPQNKTVGGSARVGLLWFQIEATAKQFSEVKEVKFWPEDLFQP
jgi:hypothetical protein